MAAALHLITPLTRLILEAAAADLRVGLERERGLALGVEGAHAEVDDGVGSEPCEAGIERRCRAGAGLAVVAKAQTDLRIRHRHGGAEADQGGQEGRVKHGCSLKSGHTLFSPKIVYGIVSK
jgi:hypothetical protein